ncbi:hypothetical protein EVA_11427 [gut metagenome]|uniref:Uncharacterized protein n=1 Tax=gut metagenome TaxID=749906 RepID=J9CK46_9ZZZZ
MRKGFAAGRQNRQQADNQAFTSVQTSPNHCTQLLSHLGEKVVSPR